MGNFGNNLATFYFKIWSHWAQSNSKFIFKAKFMPEIVFIGSAAGQRNKLLTLQLKFISTFYSNFNPRHLKGTASAVASVAST